MSIRIPNAPARPHADPLSPFDLARIREDFPALRQKVHGKPLVYLDNSATTQKPQSVLEALQKYYAFDNANVHRGAHELSNRATRDYEGARVKVQRFLNAAEAREIIFTRGTTESINLVAQTFARQNLKPGDEVLVSEMEHHSNIVPWQMVCDQTGAVLKVVPVDEDGELRMDEFDRMLGPRTKIVSISHISNALGTINPVRDIIAKAHARGATVVIDGAQAVPHLRVDVQELDCDFYAFSAHKVYGPTGFGVLYGKAALLEAMPPYQGGGDMISSVSFAKTTYNVLPYKFEAGTPHIAGAVGLGAALDYVEEIGRGAIAGHEQVLIEHAIERISAIAGVRRIGNARHQAAVVSFIVEDPPLSALDVGTRLDLEGIAVRTGHHCCQPLMERYEIPGTVRASFAVYNTLEDVDAWADALEKVVREAGEPGSRRVTGTPSVEVAYVAASAETPQAAAEELADTFEFLEDWNTRYEYIEELGRKVPAMPPVLKTDENRVRGCQSTVHIDLRQRPGTADVVEFIADSDAGLVRGLIAILEKLFSGQRAAAILTFDVQAFFRRIGLENNLVLGRRVGLAAMVERIRAFAQTHGG